MSISIIEKKKGLLLLASLIIIAVLAQQFHVNLYIQLAIYLAFLIYFIININQKMKNSPDKRRWYIRIGIAVFFMLLFIGYSIYEANRVINS